MTSNRKPRREGRGENGVMLRFISIEYNGIHDCSILKSIAFGLYPKVVKDLARIKLRQVEFRGGKNDIRR